MSQGSARFLTLLVCTSLCFGCFGSDRKPDRDGDGDGDGDGGVPVPDRDGGRDGGGGSCVVSEIQVGNNDKVDLLFVVDNSGSMREEQAALREQFQQLITVLTTGDREGDGTPDFPPVTDLHLAVVSSDMGLSGITGIPNCDNLGDDGVMQAAGDTSIPGCVASFPPFLSFIPGVNEGTQVATDLGCVASVGTQGCGFEQPLEAALKALWPAVDRGGNGAMDPNGEVFSPNRISFVGDLATGIGTTGHGDGMNAGFLRNDPTQGLSVIAVVVVSDEEDCSSRELRHFTPPQFLDPTDPLAQQDLNLRCFFNPGELFAVERYVDGLQALRPDAQSMVIFGAIVGVPADLVSAEALAAVDFTDEGLRDTFYQAILADPRMQEVPDPTRPVGQGNLVASCARDDDGDGTVDNEAFPPRRFVEVARQFGASGVLGSICQPDLSTSVNAIVDRIAAQLGAVCLPRQLVRGDDGMVGCDVLWQLPLPGTAPANTPTACSQLPFIEFVESGPTGELCRVTQLEAEDRMTPPQSDGEGWFYDDFSPEVLQSCPPSTLQRIAFSSGAKPPTGVSVKLECCNSSRR